MSVSELLASTNGYLEQLAAAKVATTSTDADPMEIPPTLIQNITEAGDEAKQEVECKNLHIGRNCFLF